MRIFITGATGFVGSAIVAELLAHGHQVTGLARSEVSAAALAKAGAAVQRGALDDLESLRAGAAAAEGVIHAAFIHDFTKFEENCAIDLRAINALGEALASTQKPLIITSGTALARAGGVISEETPAAAGAGAIPRVASEEAAAALASRGQRVSILRLAPTVHGDGDHGFVPLLIDIARAKGVAAYVGEGNNVWPAVHRLDAARLFRLALEQGAAQLRYHGVAEEGVRFRDIAQAIGRQLKLPVARLSAEEAPAHFGWFAHFAMLDNPASSADTRAALGWQPRERGLIADLDQGRYFEAGRRTGFSV
ncbi:MAG TPA: SDR family oxidoreductase [Burkholderiales bacterium]|jgi:nucleoside-diphosphate-sugar epimerase